MALTATAWALTAATGADALTHCIESFTSPAFHPLCDGIALEGIHLIANALPRVVRDGGDLEARGSRQLSQDEKAARATHVVVNDHSLEHLEAALRDLYPELVAAGG